MGKTKKKVLTIVSTFFLLFQSFGPYIFFVSPVRAQSVPEKINSNISFNNEKNEFSVSINTKEEVEYLLSYQTDKQTEAISGKSEKSDDKDFERDFYAGTCSTDGNCVDHKVLRGIFKTKVATQNFLNAKRFTFENGTFEIILDEEVDSLDFTDIEKKWLEEGTDISPPEPTAEPTEEPTPTPEGEILDGIYTSNSWDNNEDGSFTSKNKVSINTEYAAPFNNNLIIKFTKLPSNPSQITIQEISASFDLGNDRQVGSVYEITSEMKDGEFAYDLTLPIPQNTQSDNLSVKYAETLSNLKNSELVNEETIVNEESLTVKSLNHFTVFVLVDPSISGTGGSGDTSWSNISNVYASDNIRSTVSLVSGETSNNLKATGFGLSIPTGAVIEGIEVLIEKSVDVTRTNAMADNRVRLVVAGTATGDNKALAGYYNNTSDEVKTYGSPTDLWGLSLLPSQVNADNFGALYSAVRHPSGSSAQKARVDQIQIKVYYEIPSPVITSGPEEGSISNNVSQNFTFTVDSDSTAKCNLSPDQADFLDCDSPSTQSYVGLSEGPHTFSLKAVDASGNSSAVVSRSFTIDTTSPTVPSLVSPADGAYVKPAGLILDWSDVTDSEGSNPVTYKYKSSWTGGSYGPVSTGTTSHVNASGSSDRVYSWQVQACDSVGNCSNWSGPWTVTIDSAVPILAQVTPVSTPTNDATPNYIFSSNEIGTISYGGDCSSATTAAVAGNNTITFNTLPDGTHSNCTITVSDAAGNTSTPLNVSSFTIDTIAPNAPTPTSPIDGAVIQPIAFSQTWTAETGAVQYRYQSCNVSPGDFGDDCSNVRYTSTYTGTTKNVAAGQPDSHFWWRVQAKDAAGNWSLYGEARELTIDGTVPTDPSDVHSTSHTISTASNDNTIDMAWSTAGSAPGATDTGSGIDGYSYEFSVGATDVPDDVKDAEETSTGVTSSDLTDGNWYFHLRTVDNAGNWTSTAHAGPFVVDTTAPTVVLTDNHPDSIVRNANTVTITATFTEDDEIDEITPPTISISSLVNNAVMTKSSNLVWTYSWNVPAGNNGLHTVSITAKDRAGNSNTAATGQTSYTIDNTAPSTPSVTTPVDNGYIASATTQTFVWTTSTDSGSGLATTGTYQYQIDDNSDFSSTLRNVSQIGTSKTLTNPLPEGSYYIRVRAKDVAGNYSLWSTSVFFTVDSIIPSTAEISAPQNNETIKGTYTITANASDNVNGSGIDKVEFWHKNKLIILCTDNDISDGLSCDWDTNTEIDGAHTIYVTVFDKAGNFTSSSMIDVIIDNTAPIITVDSLSTTDHTPELTGDVDDNTATIGITVDGIVYTATNNADGTWTLADDTITTALSDGIYDVLASATDTVGNIGNDSTTDELEVTTPAVLGATTTTSTGGTTTDASVCTDTKPGSAPVLTSAVGGANSVTLTWSEASNPVSYYLVAYGTSPGGQTYGNPNVGGQGTTSYTISGLSGGTTYYFKVRAGNGCEPGDYSNEISASPTGGFIEGPAAGFAEGVLGVATEEANIKGKEENKQEVLGTDTQDQKKQNNIKIWTSILFLLLILLYIKNSLSNK